MLYNNKINNIIYVIYLILFSTIAKRCRKHTTSRRKLDSHCSTSTDDRSRIDHKACHPGPFPGYLGGGLGYQ